MSARATSRIDVRRTQLHRSVLLGLALVVVLAAVAVPADAYTIGPGVVWKQQESGTTSDLNAVDFISSTMGWAVGAEGVIVHTEDGGATWSTQSSRTSVDLFDVHFLDASLGWAVGGDSTVLRTTNGGASWADTSPRDRPSSQRGSGLDLYGVHFVDDATGWVVGWGGKVFSTKDGGVTWTLTLLGRHLMSDFFLHGVHFVDANNGWIAGKLGYLYGTTDGGRTWSTQLDADWGPPLLRLAFADATHGWAVGGFPGTYSMERIFHTSDGGRTWTLQYAKAATLFSDIACLDRNTAWVVDSFDNVLFTTDGGETWQKQPLVGDFGGVDFADPTAGWAVGKGGVIVKAVPAFANVTPTFSDTLSSPYMQAVELMADAWIATGYEDGTFRPETPLFRAQFAKMICLALRLPVDESMEAPFDDLGEDWPGSFYPTEYVAAAAANGIVNGVRPRVFHPWTDISRAQVVTMVVRALESVEPGRLAQPPADYRGSLGRFDAIHAENMRIAEYNHLLDGLVGFKRGWDPWAKMTRGEIAQVIWNGREDASGG